MDFKQELIQGWAAGAEEGVILLLHVVLGCQGGQLIVMMPCVLMVALTTLQPQEQEKIKLLMQKKYFKIRMKKCEGNSNCIH